MGPLFLLGLAATVGVGYAIFRSSRAAQTSPGGTTSSDGKSYTWGFLSPDAPPGNVFYVDTSTGVGVYTQTPRGKRDMLVNGSVVSAILQGVPQAAGSPPPPLVKGRFTVVANYTGEHNPHGFTTADPKGWYYDLRFDQAINDVGAPVRPPAGLVFVGIPASLVGQVLSAG